MAILEEFDVQNAFLPYARFHPTTNSMLHDQSEDDSTNEKPTDGSPGDWMVSTHRGRENYENILYVSIMGAEAIDRFSFQITNEEKGECVAQTKRTGDLPPYGVIKTVGEDYEITNIPRFLRGEDVSFSQLLVGIDSVVRRITSQIPPESNVTKKLLDEYVTNLTTYLSIVAAYEVAPREYNYGIEQAFSKLGIQLTTENISQMNQGDLDQISTVAFEAVENMDEVRALARELLDTTQAQERSSVETDSDSDTTLLAMLHDQNNRLR